MFFFTVFGFIDFSVRQSKVQIPRKVIEKTIEKIELSRIRPCCRKYKQVFWRKTRFSMKKIVIEIVFEITVLKVSARKAKNFPKS